MEDVVKDLFEKTVCKNVCNNYPGEDIGNNECIHDCKECQLYDDVFEEKLMNAAIEDVGTLLRGVEFIDDEQSNDIISRCISIYKKSFMRGMRTYKYLMYGE